MTYSYVGVNKFARKVRHVRKFGGNMPISQNSQRSIERYRQTRVIGIPKDILLAAGGVTHTISDGRYTTKEHSSDAVGLLARGGEL
jgi:hypothetical protein